MARMASRSAGRQRRMEMRDGKLQYACGIECGDMKPEIVHVEEFRVIGVAARTSNAREMTGDSAIATLWGRFAGGGAPVALYTDYESDKDGEYTFVLGVRAAADAVAPEGMEARTVPAGRYAVFVCGRGPAAQAVMEAWRRIWATPLDRAYGTDFEVYDDPVRIYVGVR